MTDKNAQSRDSILAAYQQLVEEVEAKLRLDLQALRSAAAKAVATFPSGVPPKIARAVAALDQAIHHLAPRGPAPDPRD